MIDHHSADRRCIYGVGEPLREHCGKPAHVYEPGTGNWWCMEHRDLLVAAGQWKPDPPEQGS